MSVNPSAPPRRRRAISTRFFTSGVNFAMRYLRDLPRRTHDGVDRRRLLPEADAAFFNIGTGKVHLQRHADEVAWVLLSCAGKVFLLVRKKLTTTGHRLLRRKENNGRRIARRPRSGGRWSSASRSVPPRRGAWGCRDGARRRGPSSRRLPWSPPPRAVLSRRRSRACPTRS